MNDDNNSFSKKDLFIPFNIPDTEWETYWTKIVIDLRYRHWLENYADLFIKQELKGLGGSHLVIFTGPPGTGKTSLALGYSNYVASRIKSKTMCLQTNAALWRSHWLGEAAKLVKDAFDVVRLSSNHYPTIVIIDEMETVAVSRARTVNTTEPSDVISSVNELLTQIDRLRHLKAQNGVLILATTNLSIAVDEAVLSRADLVIPFKMPDENARFQIIANMLNNLRANGYRLNGVSAEKLSEHTGGLSGRDLEKLGLRALLEKPKEARVLGEDDFLNAVDVSKLHQQT